MARARYPIFVKRDLDGFFGLAIDNLVQLLLIVSLCATACGMSGANARIITDLILPGVAVSLVIGNLFYALQAHWVARREGRSDVTALPYGINTPSLLVYIFFVMAPAWQRTEDAMYAWRLGLIACLGSGIIEFSGAFVAERVRRNTPRAALLSTLAGIAITFISMKFALEIWQRPLIAMVPMAVVLLVYFAHVRFPLGLPGGLVAVLLGTGLAWLLTLIGGVFETQPLSHVAMDASAVREAWEQGAWHWPQWVWPEIWETLTVHRKDILSLVSVIIPMGLFNVIGSLQNIESAEAGGDVFATGPSLAVNGLGTIAAALFGSCFPTTIYIGHPGWKGLGARAGYSTLNAIVMSAICLTGTVLLIEKVVPIEAGIAIVLWIGIVITAQAFQATPVRHAPAVAIGLFPAIAAWGATIVAGAFIQAGMNVSDPGAVNTMQEVLTRGGELPGVDTEVNSFLIHGMIVLERGYIFTCMIVAAISAFLIDRRFGLAAAWSLAAAVLTFTGLIHAYTLLENIVDYYPIFAGAPEGAFAYRGYAIGVGYLLMGLVFGLTAAAHRRGRSLVPSAGDPLEDARYVETKRVTVDEQLELPPDERTA